MPDEYVTIHVSQSDECSDIRDFVPFRIAWEDNLTVLRALEKIYFEQRQSIAYRHYCCHLGRCGSCLIKVNGKNVYGCKHIIEPGAELFVEPVDGRRVIRDLVVDWSAGY